MANLRDTAITERGLGYLSKSKGLAHIVLPVRLGEAGIRTIARFPGLQFVTMESAKITRGSLDAIAQIPGLSRLSLFRTATTDDDLVALIHCANLEVLDLSDTKITGKGLLKLAELSKLKILRIRGVYAPQADLNAFRKMKPDCSIEI